MFKFSFNTSSDSGKLQVHLETSRLIIRSYQEEDMSFSIPLYGDKEITHFFDSGKPRSPSEVRQLIDTNGTSYFLKGKPWGIFSIFCKQTGQFIGHIDLLPSSMNEKVLEIGYIISKDAQGNGYGIEAAQCMIFEYVPLLKKMGYNSDQLPINEVMATVHPNNIASKNILTKLGMKHQSSLDRFGQKRDLFSIEVPR